MKYAWLIWLLILLYGISPATLKTLWIKADTDDLIVEWQSCGCPCPDSKIVKGAVSIPTNFHYANTTILKNQLNLKGNSPLNPFNYEIAQSKFIITGKVVGFDTVICNQSQCEIVPTFEVNDWVLMNYVARFWTFNRIVFILFVFGIPILFIGILGLTFSQFKKTD